MPGRIGRVQDRSDVAPAPTAPYVEGGSIRWRGCRRATTVRPCGPPQAQPPSERHPRVVDPPAAGPPPGVLEPRDWITTVVPRDARAEEAPDLVPLPATENEPSEWKREAGVQPPQAAPRGSVRQMELHRGERASRAQHSHELAEGGLRIVDVAQQVFEGDRVKGSVREGELLSPPLDETYTHLVALREVVARFAQHRLCQIETDDEGVSRTPERECHSTRTSRDIEDARARW